MSRPTERSWYVAYGSNLAAARFACYIAGGRPDGASRTYTGCRDTTSPMDDQPVEVRGELLFAGHSTVWSGGMAFYRPEVRGTVAARAYLLTADQVADVVAQETRRPVGTEFSLSSLPQGAGARVREGGYDRAVRLRDLDGIPAFTITTRRPPEPNPPSQAYLRWVCAGLRETYDWPEETTAGYLVRCRGVRGVWSTDMLVDLARSA